MPKKLKYAIRESFETGKRSMDVFADDGFSGDELEPDKSVFAETIILWALNFPDENFDRPDLVIDLPVRLTQAQMKWELQRLSQRAVFDAVKCRNLKIFEEPAVEADEWDLRVRSLESVYE